MTFEKCKVVQKCMVVFAFLVFALSLIIAFLNPLNIPKLFFSSMGALDAKYYQEVSPAPLAFLIIWPIIYIWNAIAIFYILISICLPEKQSPVNIDPTLIPISFLLSYFFAFGGTLAWLFAFDREILSLSLLILIFSTILLYIALGISYKRVYDNLKQLNTEKNRVMLWLVRILIQNGLALPATWLTIATCLNLTDVIIYEDSFGISVPIQRGIISIENGSSAVLTLLFVILLIWFFLDTFVLYEYTCYTFTVYPVLILGLSGLVAKLRDRAILNQNLVLACVILSFCVVAFIARVLVFCFRCMADDTAVKKPRSKILRPKV